MRKMYQHAGNIPRLRKGEELLFWMLHKNSANDHQCNTAYSAVRVQVCS